MKLISKVVSFFQNNHNLLLNRDKPNNNHWQAMPTFIWPQVVRSVDCKHTPTLFQILNLTINIPEIYILYRVVPPQPLLFVRQSKSVTLFITLSKHVENYNHKSDTVKTLLLLRYNNAL